MRKKNLEPRKEFLVFGSPLIESAEIEEVANVLRSGWLGSGPKVKQFESDFAAYKGVEHALAVHSCTAALHLSLLAAGVGPGDEVITTAMTFCATVNAIIHTGATPVLADVDGSTMNIDPEQVEKKITNKTRAILPVHFAGRPAEMDALITIAGRQGLIIIEDCAHAIEAEYKGRKSGTFGDFGCFSFYVTKNIVTGEGGMIIARREEDARRIDHLRLHGMSRDAWKRFGGEGYRHYDVVECGYKYNMMDLQAAIGLHQLRRIDPYWKQRERIWQRYNTSFRDLPLGLPSDPAPETRHAYHLYSILIDKKRTGLSRDEFLQAMTERNIGVGVHYRSIPEQSYYQRAYGWKPEAYPNAFRIGQQTVSLPLSPKLSNDDVEDVIEAVRSVCSGGL